MSVLGMALAPALAQSGVKREFPTNPASPTLADISAPFQAGDFTQVVRLAGAACERGECPRDDRAFFAGLAAWRMQDYDGALAWFEASEPVANGVVEPRAGPHDFARGAFWAARARLRAGLARGEADAAQAYLDRLSEVAAAAPLTLYGKLSEAILGLAPLAPGLPASVDAQGAEALAGRHPALAEALTAARKGNLHATNEAVLRAVRELPRSERPWLQSFAHSIGAARAVYWIASQTGDPLADGRYPVTIPDPSDGWRIDRAIVLAIMHQESRFDPHAKSGAGARGLVQLMPSTAAWVAGDPRLKSEPNRLFEPGLNLTLGQRYIEMMFEQSPVKGDLILCLASYNAGPGTVGRWWKRLPPTEDPLLAMESLPNAEVRDYVRKVLANLWVYRTVLGQSDPSIKALASEGAPIYRELDGSRQFAEAEAEVAPAEPALTAEAEPETAEIVLAKGAPEAALSINATEESVPWWKVGHLGEPGDVVSYAFRDLIFERVLVEIEAGGLGMEPLS
jgi:soluble lytic murein transglycosylase-like protein